MTDIIGGLLAATWHILNESSLYILFGFLMAGILKTVISEHFVDRHLGADDMPSVLKASLLGIPLPLCSCAVIPMAMGLRRQGAGKGATTAFLISTPETGIDSIAITYALLDPIMTVVRPVAACLTATAAGMLVALMPDAAPCADSVQTCDDAACSSCCGGDQDHDHQDHAATSRSVLRRSLRQIFSFAFGELLRDIGPALFVGIFIAGAIAFFVPDEFIENNLGSGFVPMLIMLAAGIPVYVCATASTPIVAALALKGLSPGAALVFLLAGPATNLATITVVAQQMGNLIAAVYVLVIAAASLLLGVAVNALYAGLAMDITGWVTGASLPNGGFVPTAASVLLIALTTRALLRKK